MITHTIPYFTCSDDQPFIGSMDSLKQYAHLSLSTKNIIGKKKKPQKTRFWKPVLATLLQNEKI